MQGMRLASWSQCSCLNDSICNKRRGWMTYGMVKTTAWIEVKVKGQVLCPAVSGRLIRLRDIVLFFADLWITRTR